MSGDRGPAELQGGATGGYVHPEKYAQNQHNGHVSELPSDYTMSATIGNFQDYNEYHEMDAPDNHASYYGGSAASPPMDHSRLSNQPTQRDYTLVPGNEDPAELHDQASPNLRAAELAQDPYNPNHSIQRKAVAPSGVSPAAVELPHSSSVSPAVSPRPSHAETDAYIGSDPSRSASPNPSMMSSVSNQSNANLQALREKMDKVRAEKERLSKITELDNMEAELQSQIIAAQRAETEEHE